MKRLGEQIYLGSPAWLQNCLLWAKGAVTTKERFGREFYSSLEEARRRLQWSTDQHEEYAREMVFRLLQEVGRAHPHYRRSGLEHVLEMNGDKFQLHDLEQIPLLEKEDLRTRYYLFKEWASRITIAGYAQTTGTTGTPLRIPYTATARQRNYAFYERFLNTLGLSQFERHAILGGKIILPSERNKPPYHRYSLPQKAMYLSSYHISRDTAPAYLDALKEWKPRWVDCYPSSAYALATWLGRRLREVGSIVSIVTSASTLDDAERSSIQDAWGVPVFDHYGAAEMCAMIAQCKDHRYHVHTDFAWLEFLENCECGAPSWKEIVCTSWCNEALPLIRYRIGDIAVEDGGKCGCDLPFPTVSRIQGRTDDFIVTPTGRLVGRLSPVVKGIPVVRLQYYQPTIDVVIVRFLPTEYWDNSWAARLKKELRLRIGPELNIQLEEMPEIDVRPGGKLRNVISDVRLKDVIDSK